MSRTENCVGCGRMFHQGIGRPSRRCPDCRNRRYGSAHKRLRQLTLADAFGKPCARCGDPMLVGEVLELDHADSGRGYLGFSHRSCNRSAGALKALALRVVCDFHVPVTSYCPHSRDW